MEKFSFSIFSIFYGVFATFWLSGTSSRTVNAAKSLDFPVKFYQTLSWKHEKTQKFQKPFFSIIWIYVKYTCMQYQFDRLNITIRKKSKTFFMTWYFGCECYWATVLPRLGKWAAASQKHEKSWFSRIFGLRLPRPRAAQGELRDATCRDWAWDMIQQQKLKKIKKTFFSMTKIFSEKIEKRKMSKISKKSLFFSITFWSKKKLIFFVENVENFRKFSIFDFLKKVFLEIF